MTTTTSLTGALLTYTAGMFMVLYAVIFRGFVVHDWSAATIMMFIGIMGMCLQYSLGGHGETT